MSRRRAGRAACSRAPSSSSAPGRPASAWCRARRGPAAAACAWRPTSTPCRRRAIEGVDVQDNGAERDGVIVFGALGVGGLKMKIHKACIARLFESNDARARRRNHRRGRAGPRRAEAVRDARRMPEVLLTGVSMRAAAQSAVKAGYHDAHDRRVRRPRPAADQDDAVDPTEGRGPLRRPARVVGHRRRAGRRGGLRLGLRRRFARRRSHVPGARALWGNSPDVLGRCARRAGCSRGWRIAGIPRASNLRARSRREACPPRTSTWLEKPFHSGGGHGIRPWSPPGSARAATSRSSSTGCSGVDRVRGPGRPRRAARHLTPARRRRRVRGDRVSILRQHPVAPRGALRSRRVRGGDRARSGHGGGARLRARRPQQRGFHRHARRGVSGGSQPALVGVGGAGRARARVLHVRPARRRLLARHVARRSPSALPSARGRKGDRLCARGPASPARTANWLWSRDVADVPRPGTTHSPRRAYLHGLRRGRATPTRATRAARAGGPRWCTRTSAPGSLFDDDDDD